MSLVQIDQVPVTHSYQPHELKIALAEISDARAFTKERVKDLREAIKAGDGIGTEQAIAQLTSHKKVALVSAVRANASLPKHRRAPLEELLQAAGAIDVSEPLKEPVRCWPKPKKSGGYRIIHDHGLRHRTSQDLVKRVVEVIHKPRAFQYTHAGIHAAVARIKALLVLGHHHVAHLDIPDFYGSFKAEKLLTELPLPEGAVTNVVVGRHHEVVWNTGRTKGGAVYSFSPPTQAHLITQAARGCPRAQLARRSSVLTWSRV